MTEGLLGSQFAADRFVGFTIIVSLMLFAEFSGRNPVGTISSADTSDARPVVDSRTITPIRVIMTTVMDALTRQLIDLFPLSIFICLKFILLGRFVCGDTVIVIAEQVFLFRFRENDFLLRYSSRVVTSD